jgi:hypothetical protein
MIINLDLPFHISLDCFRYLHGYVSVDLRITYYGRLMAFSDPFLSEIKIAVINTDRTS